MTKKKEHKIIFWARYQKSCPYQKSEVSGRVTYFMCTHSESKGTCRYIFCPVKEKILNENKVEKD